MRSTTVIHSPARRARRRTGFLHWLARVEATRRERYALRRLDAHLLRDLGLEHDAAWHEARRPFWELPDRHNW